MSYVGAHPLNDDTLVGQLRREVGDITATELEPPVLGMGSYLYWSDADLAQFLSSSNGSIKRAASAALTQLSVALGMQAANIGTHDLRVATEQRAVAVREAAALLLKQAESNEKAAAQADQDSGFFGVYDPFAQRPARTAGGDLNVQPVPGMPGYWQSV